MVSTIEFDFDTHDGRTLVVLGETDGNIINFKLFSDDRRISKTTLNDIDTRNIEEFILTNSVEDIENINDIDYLND